MISEKWSEKNWWFWLRNSNFFDENGQCLIESRCWPPKPKLLWSKCHQHHRYWAISFIIYWYSHKFIIYFFEFFFLFFLYILCDRIFIRVMKSNILAQFNPNLSFEIEIQWTNWKKAVEMVWNSILFLIVHKNPILNVKCVWPRFYRFSCVNRPH